MRIDKFLKVARIIKRRTIANEACDAGRVTVNDKIVKASATVKPGDVICVKFGNKEVKVQVLNIENAIRKEDAEQMYKML